MSKQITTTKQVLVKQLEIESTVEQKAKQAFDLCKKSGFTHNKANKPITQDGLTRLMKAMLRDIKNEKKGWWSTYKIEEGKENKLKIVSKKTK